MSAGMALTRVSRASVGAVGAAASTMAESSRGSTVGAGVVNVSLGGVDLLNGHRENARPADGASRLGGNLADVGWMMMNFSCRSRESRRTLLKRDVKT